MVSLPQQLNVFMVERDKNNVNFHCPMTLIFDGIWAMNVGINEYFDR